MTVNSMHYRWRWRARVGKSCNHHVGMLSVCATTKAISSVYSIKPFCQHGFKMTSRMMLFAYNLTYPRSAQRNRSARTACTRAAWRRRCTCMAVQWWSMSSLPPRCAEKERKRVGRKERNIRWGTTHTTRMIRRGTNVKSGECAKRRRHTHTPHAPSTLVWIGLIQATNSYLLLLEGTDASPT